MTTNELSRRDFLRISLLAAAGAALAACQPAAPTATEEGAEPAAVEEPEEPTAAPAEVPTEAAPAAEPVTIRWSHWLGADIGKVVDECTAEGFAPEHPDIQVNSEWASWGEYHTKLLTALSAGTAPDLYWVDRSWSNDLIIKGQVFDPAPYIEADPEIQSALETEWPEAYLQNCSWQGDIWGLPFGGSTMMVWWHRQHFEDEGIDDPYTQYKAGKWDWEAFLTTAQAMTKRNNNGEVERYGCIVGGLHWPYITADFVWQAGGRCYDMSTTPPTIAIDSPEARMAYEWLYDLMYEHGVAPLPGAVEGIDVQQTGLVSMFFMWDGTASNWNTEGKDTWGNAPVLEGQAGRFAQGGCAPYFINSESQYPDAAWLLEKYLSLEAELCWFRRGVWTYIGANSILNSPEYLELYPAHPAELVSENRQFNRAVPQPLGAPEFESILNPDLDLYFLGQKDIDDVLANAKEQGDTILSEAYQAAGIAG